MLALVSYTVTLLPNLPSVYNKQSHFRCLKLTIYTRACISLSPTLTCYVFHTTHPSRCCLTAGIKFQNRKMFVYFLKYMLYSKLLEENYKSNLSRP
jgi:hypothetical protein